MAIKKRYELRDIIKADLEALQIDAADVFTGVYIEEDERDVSGTFCFLISGDKLYSTTTGRKIPTGAEFLINIFVPIEDFDTPELAENKCEDIVDKIYEELKYVKMPIGDNVPIFKTLFYGKEVFEGIISCEVDLNR